MATVRFTESIQRHVQCPTREIAGGIDDGLAVAQRERRRFMADDIFEPAAGLCSEV